MTAVCVVPSCARPLESSPSMFWCSDACQTRWTAARNAAVPLRPTPPVGVVGHGPASCGHLGYRGVTLARLLGRDGVTQS